MAVYLDACRRKRNHFLYERANIVSYTEMEELLWQVSAFSLEVDAWLKKCHPHLI
jgi:hypothetical protein